MPRFPTLCFLSLSVIGSLPTYGRDPPKPVPPAKAPGEENPLKPEQRFQHLRLPPDWPKLEDLKPLPPVAIPDDPPPHEGAMIDFPNIIEPPDIVDIEVLEALPGRPITGDHLVRPDGSVTLGFYGDVHLRGLTPRQAKMKIVLHLQQHLNDETLGLITAVEPSQNAEGMTEGAELPKVPTGTNPFELELPRKGPELPEVVPPGLFKKSVVPPPGAPTAPATPKTASIRTPRRLQHGSEGAGSRVESRLERRTIRKISTPAGRTSVVEQDPPPSGPGGQIVIVPPQVIEQDPMRVVAPADSLRVYVEISSRNSMVYYVQGDVGIPGRLPFTGNETVLDALNYAGGFVPTGEPEDIHLYRPARGGKPAKDYKIDHAAILKGVATANLQMFPGDRLVVGRNAIVKKTIEIDRAASPMNSVLNSLFMESLTRRYVGSISAAASPGTGGAQIKVNGQNVGVNPADHSTLTTAQVDAFIKEYFQFLWSISAKEGGAMLDEPKFREILMKRLGIPTPTAADAK